MQQVLLLAPGAEIRWTTSPRQHDRVFGHYGRKRKASSIRRGYQMRRNCRSGSAIVIFGYDAPPVPEANPLRTSGYRVNVALTAPHVVGSTMVVSLRRARQWSLPDEIATNPAFGAGTLHCPQALYSHTTMEPSALRPRL